MSVFDGLGKLLFSRQLKADRATFLTTVSAGALIANLTDPFGSGSTYTVVGTVPAQLALSGSGIVAGATAAVAGTTYSVKVRATSADGKREVAETFAFAAQAASAPTPTPTPTPSPTVTISGAQSINEGGAGATTLFTYTVTRSTAIGAVVVPWSFLAGGTDATDYTGGTIPAGGNVNMADGVLTGTIVISVNGDTVVESNETFTVLISTPVGYVAGAATSATGTILNDDAAGYAFTNVEAASYVARMTMQPNDARKAVIDTLVGSLKLGSTSGTNIWSKMDFVQIYATHDPVQASLLNAKSTSFYPTVGAGARGYVDRGFYLSGQTSDTYVDTNWQPAAAVNYTQNSAFVGFYNMREEQNTTAPYAAQIVGLQLNPNAAGGGLTAQINSSSGISGPAAVGRQAWWGFNRIAGNLVEIYKNGAVWQAATANTSVSVGYVNQNLNVGRDRGNMRETYCGAMMAGASLTAAEQLDVSNAMSAYFAAIGMPATYDNLVSEGDSITLGQGSSNAALTSRPALERFAAMGKRIYVNSNVATGGITAGTMDANFNTRSLPAIQAGRINHYSVSGGTNSYSTNIANNYLIYKTLRSILRKATAAGVTTKRIGTMIARNDPSGTGIVVEGDTALLNQLIRTYWNNDLDADAMMDFGSIPGFQHSADVPTSPYYSDAVTHPSDAGYAIMAPVAKAALDYAIANAGVRTAMPLSWSPIDTQFNATLSNGNRTIQLAAAPAADTPAKAFMGKTTGKWFWETVADAASGTVGFGMVGQAYEAVINNGGTPNLQASASAIGVGYPNATQLVLNTTIVATPGAITTGAVVQHAYDATAKLYWVKVGAGNWNGSGTANPATGVGGVDVSGLGTVLYPAAYVRSVGEQVTSRFAAPQMANIPPTGYFAYG